jgi:hypothetical protein
MGAWRTVLGFDLSGRLSSWKRRYKRSRHVFDDRTVWCGVSEWQDDSATVSASAYCDDPMVSGFDSRPLVWFYRSKKFRSRIEADAHLEAEICRATRNHPATRFYRSRSLPIVVNGRIAEEPVTIEEYCEAGVWHPTARVPSHRRCQGCGNETEETICPKCGEPVMS